LGLKRLFLHAWKLDISHPATKEPLELIAEIPKELQHTITLLEQQS
jgi:23S rRNA pseudouridine955/2504/2580 synthase